MKILLIMEDLALICRCHMTYSLVQFAVNIEELPI